MTAPSGMPSRSAFRSASSRRGSNSQSRRYPARNRTFSSSTRGGSLHTSYRQPRSSTAARVPPKGERHVRLRNAVPGLDVDHHGAVLGQQEKAGTCLHIEPAIGACSRNGCATMRRTVGSKSANNKLSAQAATRRPHGPALNWTRRFLSKRRRPPYQRKVRHGAARPSRSAPADRYSKLDAGSGILQPQVDRDGFLVQVVDETASIGRAERLRTNRRSAHRLTTAPIATLRSSARLSGDDDTHGDDTPTNGRQSQLLVGSDTRPTSTMRFRHGSYGTLHQTRPIGAPWSRIQTSGSTAPLLPASPLTWTS